ncbi:hypothetical protein V8E36_000274 [Tilletia maclaganii]
MASSTPKVKFYDVVASDGPKRHFLPNPWVTRMCLVHKHINFETYDVGLEELRAHGPGTLRERLQHTLSGPSDRPLVPMIEVTHPDSSTTLVGDTVTIAEWLDANVLDSPSLFLPEHNSGELDPTGTHFVQAHAVARLLKEGIGNSDAQWACHFELCAPEIADRFATRDSEYLKSDAKLNIENGWALFEAMDRAAMLAQTRRSLLPFCAMLQPSPTPRIATTSSTDNNTKLARPPPNPRRFFSSPDSPGFIDYVVFGRYAMTRGSAPGLNKAIWSTGSAAAREWLATYRDGTWALKGQAAEPGKWFGDVELPGIEAWVERMLDAHDGYARKFLQSEAV